MSHNAAFLRVVLPLIVSPRLCVILLTTSHTCRFHNIHKRVKTKQIDKLDTLGRHCR